MSSRRIELAFVVLAIVVVGWLAIGGQRAAIKPRSVASTYDTGPNGYRAVYDALIAEGVPVRRFERRIGTLDRDIRTLVITGYESELQAPEGAPAADPLDEGDVSLLKKFVRDGGRLIEIDDEFGGSEDIAPRVGVSSTAPKGTHGAVPIASGRYTAGVRALAGPVGAVFGFGRSVGTPLAGNGAGIVATRSTYGKGEVIAVTVPAFFANANVGKAQNAAFAYDTIAGHGPAAFDEFVHGYDESTSLWQALPRPVQAAFYIVVVAVAVGLIGANLPFAPPVPLEPPDERDTSEYLRSMGALMRRARAGRAAIAAFGADAHRRSRGAGAALAELDALTALQHPSDGAILRAAALDHHVRKEHR